MQHNETIGCFKVVFPLSLRIHFLKLIYLVLFSAPLSPFSTNSLSLKHCYPFAFNIVRSELIMKSAVLTIKYTK